MLDNTKITIITCCNKASSNKGKKLLDFEAKELSFLNPKTCLIDNIESQYRYNEFCVKELYKYFDTDFCLIVQFDGYIVDPSKWNDKFLDYDYIGAPWKYYSQLYYLNQNNNKNHLVGNGGFSLRSKRLCTILAEKCAQDFPKENSSMYNEDVFICQYKRHVLEKCYGIKFAPYDIAKDFSVEIDRYSNQFGAHRAIILDNKLLLLNKFN